MKILFDEILTPDVLLYVETQNSSFFFDFGGVLDQNVLFSAFDLISKVTIPKASSG
jgi:hypothetical protein